MMTLRRKLKRWLYGRCPGFAGSFPYYGTRVYFPRNSIMFEVACAQGIYESDNQRVLLSALRPHATVFDVGANIGLLSVPLLSHEPSVRVISLEPSPNTFPSLQRTVAESPWHDRWTALAVATGDREGSIDFFCANPALGAFDGVRDTHRAGATTKVTVPLTTLDRIWNDANQPDVCAIKIDVEGAEVSTLGGARTCIAATRPVLLIEWNALNLAAFNCPIDRLLSLASELQYGIFAMPGLIPITSLPHLRTQMIFNDSFVLLPKPE
jgi:FkbM family methyltransferase